MSLLRPTPGELLDRISILDLKIRRFGEARQHPKGLKAERSMLVSYLQSCYANKNGKAGNLFKSLAAVNSTIWECEDEIRSELTEKGAAFVGRRIAKFNDKRNSLIRRIDQAYKIYCDSEEKIYSCIQKESSSNG
jgi:hypothetical protein